MHPISDPDVKRNHATNTTPLNDQSEPPID